MARKDVSERLLTSYDTIFEDAGFIKAGYGDRMDVYDVVNGRVERFFSLENGKVHGHEYEWSADGSLRFVSNLIQGDLEGASVEFDYEHGQQYIRMYRQGKLITLDSIPLVDRPQITLFYPPEFHGLAN